MIKWTEPGPGVECQLYVRRIRKNYNGTGVYSDECIPAKNEDYENALKSLGVNLADLKKEQEELLAKNKELREQNEKLQASVEQVPIGKLLNDTFSTVVGGPHKPNPGGRWINGLRAVYKLNQAHNGKNIPTDDDLDNVYRHGSKMGCRDAWHEYVEQRETHTRGLLAVYNFAFDTNDYTRGM